MSEESFLDIRRFGHCSCSNAGTSNLSESLCLLTPSGRLPSKWMHIRDVAFDLLSHYFGWFARRISLELKLRNEDLEAFIQAMSHDVRASVRAVTMFAEAASTSEAGRLSPQGQQDLDRIRWAAQEMRELIDSLLNFSKLGRGEVRYEPINLRTYIETCLRTVEGEIRDRNADIKIQGKPRVAPADPTLLKIAITNLLSNAIKFVTNGVRPKITVSASVKENRCRIEINDNGIGIAEEDQQRIFMPFVRLYSEEQFPGIGLGLPSVRKAVELM